MSKFSLPALSYAYEVGEARPPATHPVMQALDPHVDAQTMNIHHTKHHQAYVTNLNAAIEKAPRPLLSSPPLLFLTPAPAGA